MEAYTADEKKFITMIVDKASATDSFFQKLVSEHFFKEDFRPFMLADVSNKKAILFFSEGNRYGQFFRLMNLVALIEDLEKDRLIIRMPVLSGVYFIGALFDAREEKNANGEITYYSPSSGKYWSQKDFLYLHSRRGDTAEKLDPVIFDDEKMAERLIKAFSGLVYPRESLRDLVKNKFRSVYQRRHRQIMCATWTAIALSLIFSVLSLYVSLHLNA